MKAACHLEMFACAAEPGQSALCFCTQDLEESKEEKLKREREAREAEQRSEFEQIQEARKQLPMYPYRQADTARCPLCLWHRHFGTLDMPCDSPGVHLRWCGQH